MWWVVRSEGRQAIDEELERWLLPLFQKNGRSGKYPKSIGKGVFVCMAVVSKQICS